MSYKTLQTMSRVLKRGHLQHCRLLMNNAVCVVFLPECGMRTCRKELFVSYCWSWEARKYECVVSSSYAGREGWSGGK